MPAARRGRVVTEFTEHFDVLPTILDCAGLPVWTKRGGATFATVPLFGVCGESPHNTYTGAGENDFTARG